MKRFCLFCGNTPIKKSNEHILSQWLIELTGIPSRKAFFGHYSDDGELKEMHIPFDQFKFPACKTCNENFSDLEAKSKYVVKELLADRALDSKDINLLLTWLDKIRIGLWLASLYYKNPFGIEPNFYINQGTYQRDRMLLLYKHHDTKKRLNFAGVHGYAFQIIPNCFTLIINNYAFFNLSSHNLLSEGLGLPFPRNQYLVQKGDLTFFIKGTEKIQYPLILNKFDNECSEFYQPIITDYIKEEHLAMINLKYINKIFINDTSGIGKIFFIKDNKLHKYPKKKDISWIPPLKTHKEFISFFKSMAIQTYEFQNFYLSKKIRTYDPKLQDKFDKDRDMAIVFNNVMLEKLRQH